MQNCSHKDLYEKPILSYFILWYNIWTLRLILVLLITVRISPVPLGRDTVTRQQDVTPLYQKPISTTPLRPSLIGHLHPVQMQTQFDKMPFYYKDNITRQIYCSFSSTQVFCSLSCLCDCHIIQLRKKKKAFLCRDKSWRPVPFFKHCHVNTANFASVKPDPKRNVIYMILL